MDYKKLFRLLILFQNLQVESEIQFVVICKHRKCD